MVEIAGTMIGSRTRPLRTARAEGGVCLYGGRSKIAARAHVRDRACRQAQTRIRRRTIRAICQARLPTAVPTASHRPPHFFFFWLVVVVVAAPLFGFSIVV